MNLPLPNDPKPFPNLKQPYLMILLYPPGCYVEKDFLKQQSSGEITFLEYDIVCNYYRLSAHFYDCGLVSLQS